MSRQFRFTDEFKKDAVAQVVDRGCAIRDVAGRLGISTKSRYTWRTRFSKPAKVLSDEAALIVELRQVRKELARITEESNILKRQPRTSRASPFEIRVH